MSQKIKSGKVLKLRGTGINPKSKVIKKAAKISDESEPKCESSGTPNNSQNGNTTNIINNISNNNTNFNNNYNVTTCKVENITQNFYITLEHNHQQSATQYPQKETSPFNIPNLQAMQK